MSTRGMPRGRRGVLWAAALAAAVASVWPCGSALAAAPAAMSLSVFVPDSSAATERFALAEKLQGASEWGKAAEVYQELLDGYRDRVVPAPGGDGGLFVSVAERAVSQLAAWPADGIAAYNGRFQPKAQAMLEAADDAPSLAAVVNRYLLTKAGQAAASRLIQVYWDGGELASAARLAERLAAVLPSESPDRPVLLVQAGVAWHLSGNPSRAATTLADLKARFADSKVKVGGEEKNAVAELEAAMGRPVPGQTAGNAWPMFGGTADRASLPTAGGRADAMLFSIDVAGQARPDQPNQPILSRMALNQSLVIQPVYDNRELFFMDALNLYGVSIDGGMKLPGWPATSVQLIASSPMGPMLRSVAVSGDSIYVVVADLTQGAWMGDGAINDNSAILCVDRATGRVRWKVTPANLGVKSAQLASSPLLVGDRLYVAARGGRNAQFHDVYLMAINATNGKLVFSSYVASGSNLNSIIMEELPIPVENGLPQLSYHAGQVQVVTNAGVVGSFDAHDGTPQWLRVYQRVDAPAPRMGLRPVRLGSAGLSVARIFAASPAIVSGGKVFALPVDGRQILVIDEVDGRVLKQISRGSLGNVDMLVAIRDGQLVVAGERVATALDWQKAEEEPGPLSEAISWTQDQLPLRGRPFLTSDSLFLPSDDRLLRVGAGREPKNWKVEQTTPPYPAIWPDNQGPGNVLVTDEHVVIATQKRVNVYTNLSAATARMDAEIAAHPTSPEPMIRYGELLFAAAKYSESLSKFRAAAKLVDDEPASDARSRLFSATLTCASRQAMADAASPQVTPLLEVSANVARTPAQKVQLHLVSATLNLRRNDGPSAMRALQAILDDPALRGVLYRDVDGMTRYAGDVARRQVSQLMDRYGSVIYREQEQRAADELTAAEANQDAAALMEVARKYPNSASAPMSLFVAGQRFESQRRLSDAAAAYRQLVQDYPGHRDLAKFVEAMARVYAATPGKAMIAASRLSQVAALRADPSTQSPIRLPTGELIQPGAFSQVAEAIRSAAGVQSAPSLPDLDIPPAGNAFFGEFSKIDLVAERLLPPVRGTAPEYRRAVALLAGGAIAVIDPSQKVIGRVSSPQINAPTACAWINSTTLLLQNATEIVAADVTRDKVLWRVVPEDLPAVAQIADEALPEAGALSDDAEVEAELPPGVMIQRQVLRRQWVNPGMPPGMALPGMARREPPPIGIADLAIVSGKVVFGTSTGRLAAVDSASGKMLWQLRPEGASIPRISCSDDFTAAKVLTPRQQLVVCVDNDSGKIAFMKATQNDPVQNVLLTADGQLVYTTAMRVVSKDLFDNSERLLFETTMQTPTFAGEDAPDQLVMVGDVIVASADGGAMVRLFSRHTGRQLLPGGREAINVAAARLDRGGRLRAHIVTADPYLYVYNQQQIRGVNTAKQELPDRRLPEDVKGLKAVVPSVGYLVAVDQQVRVNGEPTVPEIRLFAFSRAMAASGESGRLDHTASIRDSAGIASWQLMEGGLLLTTGDKRMLFYPIGRQ